MEFDVPLAFKALLVLAVVIGLIVVVFWLVRRFGGDRLGSGATRGRQPRLAVIDAAMVDGRRRLVLIRRDNVEHLLIIGGPTDVVVEQNIVRAAGAPREMAPARPPAAPDALPRAVPLGEGTMWPLQPEPAPRPESAVRLDAPPRLEPAPRAEPRGEPLPRIEPVSRAEPMPRAEPAARHEPTSRPEAAPRPQRPPPTPMVEEPVQWSAEPEPQPPARERRPRPVDPLAGLAEELARAPMPIEPANIGERQTEARQVEQRQVEQRQPLRRQPRPQAVPPAAPAPPAAPPAPAADAQFNSSADQNLAEMAQRLEAALRRPVKTDDGRAAAQAAPRAAPEPAPTETEEDPPAPARAAANDMPRVVRAGPARADAKPATPKSLYDSLEQEMASLLGRPNTKP
jgi:flagellar protein FliO/FliZ